MQGQPFASTASTMISAQALENNEKINFPNRRTFQEAFNNGDFCTTKNFAQALTYLRQKPPASYVESVIQRYDLPDATVNQLKQVFQIK